jgi:PTS system sucrose-specific IIC component
MLAIIITGFLTFTIVGPVLRTVSDGLTSGLVWLYSTTGWIGMGIFGLFYSAIVITGLHQTFPAIETQLLAQKATTGGSFIFPVASMANIAQGGAAAAIFFATKDSKQKALASASSVSAMLGITEPAIFGVNLKLKFPFICAAIASGIASAMLGMFHVLSVSMGPAGLIGFVSIATQSIPLFLLCAVVSLVISFSTTFVYAKRVLKAPAQQPETSDVTGEPVAPTVSDEVIVAPVTGKVEDISKVNDQVFATGIMGKGIAIIPDSDQVVSPATGMVTVAYPTKHAYGIKSNDGAEILVHLGIDTVNLKGEHFTSTVQQGDQVTAGAELGTFDRTALKQAGYDDTVMVVITNTGNYADVQPISQDTVQADQQLIALTAPSANAPVAANI